MTGSRAARRKQREHVQALDRDGLALLIKALGADIPRMQSLLAAARVEARRRKMAAKA